MHRLLNALFFATAMLAGAAPVTQTFYTAKDTYISQEKEGVVGDRTDFNFGANDNLRIWTESNGQKNHVLVGFDLSSIPLGSTITSASLVMGEFDLSLPIGFADHGTVHECR